MTNYLSEALKEAHQFLLQYVPAPQLFLNASDCYGGYVIKENGAGKVYYHCHLEDKYRYVDSATRKPKRFDGKSLSIKSTFSDGEMPCSTTVTQTTISLQKYLFYLDAMKGEELPLEYWREHFPQEVSSLSGEFFWIAINLYQNIKEWRYEPGRESRGRPPMIYFED